MNLRTEHEFSHGSFPRRETSQFSFNVSASSYSQRRVTNQRTEWNCLVLTKETMTVQNISLLEERVSTGCSYQQRILTCYEILMSNPGQDTEPQSH